MIVVPASLRSDFIHMAGMTIHIALESTIHIVGIRSKPYKFTLFYDGDRVFSTETRGVNGAVKDVCNYIQKQAKDSNSLR